MNCEQARNAVLLNIVDAAVLESARLHIQTCTDCSGDTNSDLTQSVISQMRLRSNRSPIGRSSLAFLGIVQLVLALPWLFGTSPLWDAHAGTHASHLARDGALGIVFGLVAVSVAFSPRLAVFALPVTFIMLLVQTVTGVFDSSQQNVHISFESVHIIGALISIGVAILARPKRGTKVTAAALRSL